MESVQSGNIKKGIKVNRYLKKGTDLALIIDNRMSPENPINEKVNTRVAFKYVIEKIVMKLNTPFIRPVLQYLAIV